MITTRKRGTTYYIDATAGSSRLRGSLGTKDRHVASRLRAKVELALAEGSKATGWADLRRVLPPETYSRFSSHVGLVAHVAPTWSGLVSIFWKNCERKRLKKGSVVRYQTTVDRFTEFLESKKLTMLEDISQGLVAEFRDWRSTQLAKNTRSRNGSGLYQDMSCLRLIMAVGVEEGLLAKNPVQKEAKPDTVRGTKPYSGEELERIWDACETDQDRLLYLLFRWTGMRGSDVADLRWGDVHFLDGMIRRRAIKNGNPLNIPIQSDLLDALKKAYAGQKPETNVITIENKVVGRAQIARRMRLIECAAKITEGHPHRFRATFAVDMLLKEATTYHVGQLLGDKEQTVEKHYLSFVPQMQSRVRELMEDKTKGLEAI